MKINLLKTLNLLMIMYFTFLIIFKMHYMFMIHAVNLLVIVNFVFLIFIEKNRIQFNALIGAYALFTLIALASSLWAINFDNSSFKSLQLFIILINLIVIYNCMKRFDLQNTFIYGILLGSFINYLVILGIVSVPFPIIDLWGKRYFGTLGNANSLAILMIISIAVSILVLHRKEKKGIAFVYYQYINIILAIYMIMLSMSKKGIIFGLLLITMFIFLSLKSSITTKNMLKLGLISLFFMVMLFNFINIDNLMNTISGIEDRFMAFESQITASKMSRFGSSGERLYFMQLGFDLFTDQPLLGYGLDNFREFAHTYSHNNYIELLVGVGFIGMVMYYLMHINLAAKILKMKDLFLKNIFITVLCIVFFMDIALVSYKNKILLFFMLFIAVIAEIDSEKKLEGTNHAKKG